MLIDETIYSRVIRKKKELDAMRPLSKSVLGRLRKQFAIELAYNSNAIEGNTLTLRETQLVIESGITIGGKLLREHLEAVNHQHAFRLLEDLVEKKAEFSGEVIREIHSIILAGIDDANAGVYRRANVRILGAVKSPPRFEKVSRLMDEFIEYVRLNPDGLNPLEMGAMIHYRLVEIHPFTDGNGRTARLLMNLWLMSHGYPGAMVLKVDRRKYYDRLKKADKGDIKPFMDFMAQSVERSLDLYLDSFSGGEDYLTLAEAAEDSPYSQEYLSLLARRGKLGAIKIGRNWHVKKEALAQYAKEKRR